MSTIITTGSGHAKTDTTLYTLHYSAACKTCGQFSYRWGWGWLYYNRMSGWCRVGGGVGVGGGGGAVMRVVWSELQWCGGVV